jgi:3-deoxy-D-manno-octulosonate 8-phosphate phosphatase KdsC-like HAD superfamily phosphatase
MAFQKCKAFPVQDGAGVSSLLMFQNNIMLISFKAPARKSGFSVNVPEQHYANIL